MKKLLLYILIFIFISIFYSCNNIFDPNASLRERYVLTGIMRSDTSLQIVTITHTYRASGEGTDAPYIVGAEVNVWYKEKLFELRDTVITREDTSRYKEPVHCYYINNLKPASNQYIDIEALLPNGLLLQSTTQTPSADSSSFFDIKDDKVIPPQNKNNIDIIWKPLDKVLFSPKIEIVYYKSGDPEGHLKEVPLFYYDNNGVSTPFLPRTTTASSVSISLETVNQALREISAGDDKKNDYSIVEMDIIVIAYDQFLSSYYSSIQPPSNGFTVTLDIPDYSNIQGGYGIFGSYVKRTHRITFTSTYLSQFGYH
jgi:Domain of unknown function (DUF4249)